MSVKFQIHEMVKSFPKMSKDSFNALMMSIQERGLQTPITLWNDGATDWVIDGRNRLNALETLRKKGIKKADNGEPLNIETVEFKGTEAEAIDYARMVNGNRRNISSGQLAASTVDNYELKRAALKTEYEKRGEEIPKEPEDGDLADKLAKQSGTNRAYIFECRKIRAVDRNLLRKIIDGDKSIPEVKKAVARVKKNLPPFPTADEKKAEQEVEEAIQQEVEGQPQGEVTSESAPPIFDGLGNEVAPEHREIFESREKVKQILKEIGIARKTFEEYAKGPGGSWAQLKETLAEFATLSSHIRTTQPHIVCPYCEGTGKIKDEGKTIKCGYCKKACFLDLVQFKALPEEMKPKKAESDI